MIRAVLFIGLVWLALKLLGVAPLFHGHADIGAIVAGLLVVGGVVALVTMVGVSILSVLAGIVAIPLLVVGLILATVLAPLWVPLLLMVLVLKCLVSVCSGPNAVAWR